MAHKQRAAIVALLIAGTWSSARADTYAPDKVMVPAYWSPTSSDFDVLAGWDNGGSFSFHGIQTVVVNLGCEAKGTWDAGAPSPCEAQPGSTHPVAGGPGSENDPDYTTKRQELAAKIQQLRQEGILVFGYVDFYANRPAADIEADIVDWTSNYYCSNCGSLALDGIFFDDADRTSALYIQGAVQRAEFFTNFAYNNIVSNGNVMFNYGETRPLTENLVSCLANYTSSSSHQMFNTFVTQETWASTYLNMSASTDFGVNGDSAWMIGYNPAHFVNVVHNVPPDADERYVNSLVQQSRQYNATQLYVTNYMYCPPDNPDPNCATQCPPGNSNPLCHAYRYLADNSVSDPGTATPIFDWLYTDAATHGIGWYPYGGDTDPAPGGCPQPDAFAQEQ